MARLFDDGSSEYLKVLSTPVSDYPITLACRFRSNDDTALQRLVMIGRDTDFQSDWVSLIAAGTVGGDPIQAECRVAGGAQDRAVTSSGFTANTWHSAMGVFASNVSRAVYIDGGSKGTNVTDCTFTGALDDIAIGTRIPSEGQYMSGDIGEVPIWNVALTDAEAASWGLGVSPLLIRPASLVFYWDGVRTLIDRIGGLTLTATGTAVSAHPRVFYPRRRGVVVPAAGAPPAGNPWYVYAQQ